MKKGFSVILAVLIFCVVSVSCSASKAQDAVSIEDIFLALPDTVTGLIEGTLSASERAELLESYKAGSQVSDGETAIGGMLEQGLSMYLVNGFGLWSLDCVKMDSEILAVVIADVIASDTNQIVEFYVYKDGKATKTEKYGFNEVQNRLAELNTKIANDQCHYAEVAFNSETGVLEFTQIFLGEDEYNMFVWTDFFGFNINEKKFELIDQYPVLSKNPIDQEIALYDGFAQAVDQKNYILALPYISRESLFFMSGESHEGHYHGLDDAILAVLTSGSIIEGDDISQDLYSLEDILKVSSIPDSETDTRHLEVTTKQGTAKLRLLTTYENYDLSGTLVLLFSFALG